MNIEIKIDEPKTDKLKRELNRLWDEMKSLPENNDAVTPVGRVGKQGEEINEGWLLHSEEGLPFLEEALRKLRQRELSYKISVCDVDKNEDPVWHRSF